LISNLISVILSLEGEDIVGFNMNGKTRLQSDYMAPYKEECQVIFRDSELIQGVIDKAMIGNSEKGLVHAFFELYDANATGRLLSCISKVAMAYM
jgi:DNA-directed RNA polymerase I subunit RPA1